MYISPDIEELKCTLGRMVSKNTISAEGKLLLNCMWDKPIMNTLGFFLLEPRENMIVVRQFIEIK